MSAQTKKVIILGHGFIKKSPPNPSSASANIHFYCPANCFLDRQFIPTFIQYILGQVDLNYVKYVINDSGINGKSDYQKTFQANEPFPFKDYDKEHIVSSKGEYMFQMQYSSHIPTAAINYAKSPIPEPIGFKKMFTVSSESLNIKIGNGVFIQYELQDGTIVIVPMNTCSKDILLSDIIAWATSEYPGVSLEFHWLACREPYLDNDNEDSSR